MFPGFPYHILPTVNMLDHIIEKINQAIVLLLWRVNEILMDFVGDRRLFGRTSEPMSFSGLKHTVTTAFPQTGRQCPALPELAVRYGKARPPPSQGRGQMVEMLGTEASSVLTRDDGHSGRA